MMAYGIGQRLRFTHCEEFHYLKLCRPDYFVEIFNYYIALAMIR